MSSDYFPLDIWREILVRLPAKSLIRGRAVSKGWRAVIDDPFFVRAHTKNLQHHQLSSSKIIIQSTTFYSNVGPCYSLDLESLISCSNGHQAAIAATPFDLEFICTRLSSLRVAACNGLVLTNKPLTIWNPLTHERLRLPRGYIKYVWAIGLGYDSTNDDYKAVVILRSRETLVYSLKSDSWRSITNCPCEGDWRGPVGPGVFVCGALNWLSTINGRRYDDRIGALDLRTEKYSLLQMPHQTRLNKTRNPTGMLLNVLGGCLALCDSGYESHVDVWVMKVYGDDDSWIKLFSIKRNNISRFNGFLRPVAFIMKENNLLVFLQDSYYWFYLFDVETKSLKCVGIDGGSGSHSYAQHSQQMFVGNIFRLHDNCGGGVRNIDYTKKKKKKMKKKKKSSEDVE